jgi:hypothetical protein
MKTVIENYKKIQEIGTQIEIPFEVWRLFPGPLRTIEIHGNEINLGEDLGSIDDVRIAIDWFATQFGGKVKWEKL